MVIHKPITDVTVATSTSFIQSMVGQHSLYGFVCVYSLRSLEGNLNTISCLQHKHFSVVDFVYFLCNLCFLLVLLHLFTSAVILSPSCLSFFPRLALLLSSRYVSCGWRMLLFFLPVLQILQIPAPLNTTTYHSDNAAHGATSCTLNVQREDTPPERQTEKSGSRSVCVSLLVLCRKCHL